MSYVKLLWDQTKESFFFYLAVITIVLLWSWQFGLDFVTLSLLLVGGTWLRLLIKKCVDWRVYAKSAGVIVLFVAAFWFLPRIIGWWFIWVLLIVFVIYKFWRGRKVFMSSMRFIETKLFGKPLDKKEWEKAEKPSVYAEEKRKNER